MPSPKRYPDELRQRAVRLVFDSGRPIAHVARDLGIKYESLRQWVRQAEADASRDAARAARVKQSIMMRAVRATLRGRTARVDRPIAAGRTRRPRRSSSSSRTSGADPGDGGDGESEPATFRMLSRAHG